MDGSVTTNMGRGWDRRLERFGYNNIYRLTGYMSAVCSWGLRAAFLLFKGIGGGALFTMKLRRYDGEDM